MTAPAADAHDGSTRPADAHDGTTRAADAHDGNTPSPGDYLADLRASIDEIDDRFVKLLAERFDVTREVGQLKADLGMPAIDQTRENQVDDKARRLAEANGLDADLVSQVLRTIIDRVVAEHRTIAETRTTE